MKTIFLFFLLFYSTTVAISQIKQGQFLLGGGISFKSVKSENTISSNHQANNFFVAPDLGYFFIDKMAGGLRLDLGSYHSKSGELDVQTRITTMQPFLRYYLLPAPKKVNAFVDISYVHQNTKWSSDDNTPYFEKAGGYSIVAGPSIFLTKQIALEFTVGYKRTKSNGAEETISKTFNTGFGLQIHLGSSKKGMEK